MVISPDVGGVSRARGFAKRLDVNLAIIDKRRERAGVVRGHERDRRRVAACAASWSTTSWTAAAPCATPPTRCWRPGRCRCRPTSRTACSRPVRWPGSRRARSERLVITDSIRPSEGVRVTSKVRVALGGAAHGRGDQPDLERELGLQPVRLRLVRFGATGLSGVPPMGVPEGRKGQRDDHGIPGRAARAVGQGPGAAAAARAQDPGDRLWRRQGAQRIAMPLKEIRLELSKNPRFFSTVFELDFGGERLKVLPREAQLHPVTRRPAACRFPARRAGCA